MNHALSITPKMELPATASGPLQQFMQTHLGLPARKASPSLGLLLAAATGIIPTSSENDKARFATRLSMAMNDVRPLPALQSPQLSGLNKAAPTETAQALTQLLTTMNSRFNFAANKKMNDMQIGFLVGSILTTHWQFKFDEVVYVLREGIAGRLHTFDHIDEAVVLNWFREYDEQQREDLLSQHAHAARAKSLEPARPIEAMGPLYVKQYCVKLAPDQLPAYKAQLQANHPDKPELAQAVEDYAASLWVQAERDETRREEQRERARRMLDRYEAGDFTTPGEREFEGLPKLAHLKDAAHTSAEEAA